MTGSGGTDREPAGDADLPDDRTLISARRAAAETAAPVDDTVLSPRRSAHAAGADADAHADDDTATVGVTRRSYRDTDADDTAVSLRGRAPVTGTSPASVAPLAAQDAAHVPAHDPDAPRPPAPPIVGRADLPADPGGPDLPYRGDRVDRTAPVDAQPPRVPVDGDALGRARRRVAARRLAAIGFVAASVVMLSAAVLAALLPAR